MVLVILRFKKQLLKCYFFRIIGDLPDSPALKFVQSEKIAFEIRKDIIKTIIDIICFFFIDLNKLGKRIEGFIPLFFLGFLYISILTIRYHPHHYNDCRNLPYLVLLH